jgi:hypothetical protein
VTTLKSGSISRWESLLFISDTASRPFSGVIQSPIQFVLG